MACTPNQEEQTSAQAASSRAQQEMAAIDQGIDAIKAQLPMNAGPDVKLIDIKRDETTVRYVIKVSNPKLTATQFKHQQASHLLSASCGNMNRAFEQGFNIRYDFDFHDNSAKTMTLSK